MTTFGRQRLFVIAVILLLSLGCAQAGSARLDNFGPVSQDSPAPWTGRSVPPVPDDFRFVIMADRTGGLRPGVFEAAAGKVNLLRPDFVMSVGDYITGYSEDAAEVDRQWDEFDAIVRGLDMPFFYIPGNHDITNALQVELWRQRLGRTYYHFLYKDVLFLCLNTQDGAGQASAIGKEQVAYAQDVLARHPGVRWTFVFMHQPLWRQGGAEDLSGWKPIEDALHGRPYTVFAGHNHSYEQSVRDGHDYIQLATTGAGTDLSGPFYGKFDHVMWITMTPQGPRYANLMLDGIAAKDVATPATRAYARDLDSKITVEAEPLIGGPILTGAMTSALRLRNDTDLVQLFEGAWEPHATLTLSPPFIRVTLNPGEEQVVRVGVSADQPVPLEATASPRVAWTQRMNPKGYGEVSRTFSTNVPLDTVYPCARAPRPVVVDGDLSDWPDLPYRVETRDRITYPENWSGPEDGSVAFATAYDDEFLYVAVKTTDDKLMVDRADVPWSQDSIAVSLDARPEQVRASAPPDSKGQFTSHLLYYLSPSESGKMIWYLQDRLPEGSKAVCVPAGQGMTLEIAVPAAYLNELQGGAWTSFQINLLFNDVDLNGVARLRWRPDWYGSQTYRGTGTFHRE